MKWEGPNGPSHFFCGSKPDSPPELNGTWAYSSPIALNSCQTKCLRDSGKRIQWRQDTRPDGSSGKADLEIGVNSQAPRWRLPPSHQESLRTALRVSASKSSVTPEQRTVIRAICSAPERYRFEPEDFLIAFKLAVVDAANDVGIPPGPERNDFLAKLVSVYIEEFYRLPIGNGTLTNSDAARTSPDGQPSA